MYFLEDLDEEDYEIAIKVSYVKIASNVSTCQYDNYHNDIS